MDANLSAYDDFLRVTGPDRLRKILARHELFRRVVDLPGDIVECGVFKGSGLFTWVKLIQIFKPAAATRVYGFDFFEAERDMSCAHPQDQVCLDFHAQGWQTRDAIIATCKDWGFDRLELIAGNVCETTKKFSETRLGTRISLLYIDVDNYEGALDILRNLYPLVVPNGIVAFDEYALSGFGEANAVDEYFAGKSVKLQTLPWANTPSAFIVKERFEG
jgi:hypothetical protein